MGLRCFLDGAAAAFTVATCAWRGELYASLPSPLVASSSSSSLRSDSVRFLVAGAMRLCKNVSSSTFFSLACAAAIVASSACWLKLERTDLAEAEASSVRLIVVYEGGERIE